jgi:hypothetical protein
MKCPKCGLARPLADQVCRRCKYVFDEDRFLALEPPRAKGGATPAQFFEKRSWNLSWIPWKVDLKPWVAPVASLVPGLGHVLLGRPWLGALYFILVAAFGYWSVTLFSESSGRMLFGIAVSTHATCILDTTPWGRSPALRARMLGMAAVLSGLILLYWPLVVHLANRFVAPVRRDRDAILGTPFAPLGTEQIVMMVVLFVSTILVSAFLGRLLSSKEP